MSSAIEDEKKKERDSPFKELPLKLNLVPGMDGQMHFFTPSNFNWEIKRFKHKLTNEEAHTHSSHRQLLELVSC